MLHIPNRPDRQRRVLDDAGAEVILTPRERAQEPLIKAADRIHAPVERHGYEGFGNLALEHDPPSLVLFWKGSLPERVDHLVEELRSSVRVVIHEAPYSERELVYEARRLIGLDRTDIGVRILSVGALNDSSGLSVVIDHVDDLARAEREIKSPIKLEFGPGGPILPPNGHR